MLRRGSIIPEDLRRAFRETPRKLLILLILADLVFITLYLLYAYTDIVNINRLNLQNDRGPSETYQYIKEFWTAVLLLSIAFRQRSLSLFSWSLAFFYILFDDALRIHERAGSFLGHNYSFGNLFDMQGQEVGQLIWLIIIGTIFLILISISYFLSDKKHRRILNSILALVAIFAFFAVFIDAVHINVLQYGLHKAFVLIEEGGEMLVMSVITWYVFYLGPDQVETG